VVERMWECSFMPFCLYRGSKQTGKLRTGQRTTPPFVQPRV